MEGKQSRCVVVIMSSCGTTTVLSCPDRTKGNTNCETGKKKQHGCCIPQSSLDLNIHASDFNTMHTHLTMHKLRDSQLDQFVLTQ